ncbi:hypothetical protein OIE42_34705 [Streptomyces sp. NBC_00648]
MTASTFSSTVTSTAAFHLTARFAASPSHARRPVRSFGGGCAITSNGSAAEARTLWTSHDTPATRRSVGHFAATHRYVRTVATDSPTSSAKNIPAADAGDNYAVSFLIDNEDDDPRQPTLTIGYNTETQARHSIQDASDQAEARWNYAFWIQHELIVVGDLTSDPAGATARQEWISDLGLWYAIRPTSPPGIQSSGHSPRRSRLASTRPAASSPEPSIRPASSKDLSAEPCR